MARSLLLPAVLALLCAAGFAAAESSPLSVWASGAYLSRSVDEKSVYTAQALEELFSFLTGTPSGAPAALAGLVDAHAAAEERPRVAVVVASAAEATSPAVLAQLEALTAAAGSHVRLPNAAHEGPSHPVFGGLRRCTRRSRVRMLGRCIGSTPSTGAATAASLRAELEAARDAEQPTIVVLCPPPASASTEGGTAADPEAELLAAAAGLLKELAPEGHLLVRAVHAASAAQHAQHEARRRLLAAAAVRGDAANRTSNYTVCDATCHKHVMWFQGLIIAVVLLVALAVGCTCMHMVDVPTRYAQPQASRPHQD